MSSFMQGKTWTARQIICSLAVVRYVLDVVHCFRTLRLWASPHPPASREQVERIEEAYRNDAPHHFVDDASFTQRIACLQPAPVGRWVWGAGRS
jgi:hypothetical protein